MGDPLTRRSVGERAQPAKLSRADLFIFLDLDVGGCSLNRRRSISGKAPRSLHDSRGSRAVASTFTAGFVGENQLVDKIIINGATHESARASSNVFDAQSGRHKSVLCSVIPASMYATYFSPGRTSRRLRVRNIRHSCVNIAERNISHSEKYLSVGSPSAFCVPLTYNYHYHRAICYFVIISPPRVFTSVGARVEFDRATSRICSRISEPEPGAIRGRLIPN